MSRFSPLSKTSPWVLFWGQAPFVFDKQVKGQNTAQGKTRRYCKRHAVQVFHVQVCGCALVWQSHFVDRTVSQEREEFNWVLLTLYSHVFPEPLTTLCVVGDYSLSGVPAGHHSASVG